jgi:SAM-dependent methyltransferase
VSHPEQLGFFSAVAEENEEVIRDGKIVEIGSFDVNGSVRAIFRTAAEYLGVDLQNGPGVDVVALGHEVDWPDGTFDVAVSGECFEHDPHWRETFLNMCRMTRPGGLVAFTCASEGRPEHGTARTDVAESPGTQSRGLDYYQNLKRSDFESGLPLHELFSSFRFWYLRTSFDLYFAGVRSGAMPANPTARLPREDRVKALRALMSLPHRAARMPLRVMVRVLPERRFQDWALPYWRTLLMIQDRLGGGRFRRAGPVGPVHRPGP